MDFVFALSRTLSLELMTNRLSNWALAVVIAVSVYNLLMTGKVFFRQRLLHSRRMEQWEFTRLAGVLVDSTTRLFILMLSVYTGALLLDFSSKTTHILGVLASLIVLWQIGYWGKCLVDYKFDNIVESKRTLSEKQQLTTLMVPIKFLVLAAIWALVMISALGNLGINVTALIAGLGISGVAIALAVQSTLADLLAALSIVLDKPFIVGDFIVTDNHKGTVEKIGLKTTRIRSLEGEELIVPNQNLLKSVIRNYKRMRERRIVFTFKLLYQTPYDQLKKVDGIVKDIVESIGKTRFDRAHFQGFGDTAYEFEVVYYVLDADYKLYMDIQQAINLALVERFARETIEFFYPR
jgi:small-conductance mechanosensitive channel